MGTPTTDLEHAVAAMPLVDSHEHLGNEEAYVEQGGDVLTGVINDYAASDLSVAGAPQDALRKLRDRTDPDVAGRFEAIRPYWERIQHTGYGEACHLTAQIVYGIEKIDAKSLAETQAQTKKPVPGDRMAILKKAGIDHVQIDTFDRWCDPDPSGPDFFLYDISLIPYADGVANFDQIRRTTGVEVKDLKSFRLALETLFDDNAGTAVAAKIQHAYGRTLAWHPVDESDVDRLVRNKAGYGRLTLPENLSIGDWAIDYAATLCAEHDLPLKIHTGYLAGSDYMDLQRTNPAHLCPLIARHPKTRFDLFHTGYPYGAELASMAKHFANVYADMCWAWTIDPYNSVEFVRRMVHIAPSHKLFVFGGDTFLPEATVGLAAQARKGLVHALAGDPDLGEKQAHDLAEAFMWRNAFECFRVPAKKEASAEAIRQGRKPRRWEDGRSMSE